MNEKAQKYLNKNSTNSVMVLKKKINFFNNKIYKIA